jgi:hypothetical protein
VSGTRLSDVFEIGQTSHGRNAESGLSGGLDFGNGWFAQVLEGLRLRFAAPMPAS